MATRNKLDNYKNTNPIFVWDNTKIYKSNDIQNYWEHTVKKILAPTPYWPCLNQWEHLIGAIKEKIRSKTGSGR